MHIIAFAGLEEFVDLKLKNYSSGMTVRLAFSIAIEVDADVLLVDEVLAVGDAAFQHKCYQQFERLKSEGKTIIFVTHDMSAVERFCDRALLIEKGDPIIIGAPREVARAYNQLNFGGIVHETVEEGRHGDQKSAEITRAWFENESWQEVTTLAPGRVLFRPVRDPLLRGHGRPDRRLGAAPSSRADGDGRLVAIRAAAIPEALGQVRRSWSRSASRCASPRPSTR